jgi:simple sugar transport system ATP-binding protein
MIFESIDKGKAMDTPFFELRNITKYFAKVIANKDVSFTIRKGEVLALLGENGAGKSTCMKILYGLYKADEGVILKDGIEQHIGSPRDAMALNISMIQQHFSLVPAHTVTENIILGSVHGAIHWSEQEQIVTDLATKYGFAVNPKAIIRNLSVGEQQKVEIVKALYLQANLLIMDEPTAVLTPQEAENLMVFVRTFVKAGNSVIFITHKLKEVMEVADRIIVMREGKVFGDLKKSDTNEHELSYLMIDKEIVAPEVPLDAPQKSSRVCLKVAHLTLQEKGEVASLADISFSLQEGEILGIAGVSGNGQQELCEAICGTKTPNSGSIFLGEKDITHLDIRSRINLGIGYVPSDRQRFGMVMNMTLAENMMLKDSYDKKWLKHGFIDSKKLQKYTSDMIKEYDVKAPGPEALAKSLSGGNQQKVIVAREVYNGSNLVIYDQPTRGLDLGAINHVHKTIMKERAKGKGILLISTELSEIFALSDRIAVLYKGKIQGIFKRNELSTQDIGFLMAGYSKGEGTK